MVITGISSKIEFMTSDYGRVTGDCQYTMMAYVYKDQDLCVPDTNIPATTQTLIFETVYGNLCLAQEHQQK